MQLLSDINLNQAEADAMMKTLQSLDYYCDIAENLNETEIEDFIKSNSDLTLFLPIQITQRSNPNLTVERIIINKTIPGYNNQRVLNLADIRYPPRKHSSKIGWNRASMKGQIMFYGGTLGPLPLSLETSPKKGEIITKSKWQLRSGKTINVIDLCQSEELVNANPIELQKDFREYNNMLNTLSPHTRTVVEEFYKLLIKAFTKKVDPAKKQGYLISAFLADFIFQYFKIRVDAIRYPSIPFDMSAMNIALQPDVLDESFQMIEAIDYEVIYDPSLGKNMFKLKERGTCHSYHPRTLNLNWNHSKGNTDHVWINEVTTFEELHKFEV